MIKTSPIKIFEGSHTSMPPSTMPLYYELDQKNV